MREGSATARLQRVDKFTHYDLVIYAARGSDGARRLATTLGSRRWRDDLPERYTRRRPFFRGNQSPVVVNWGSTVHPRWLNDPRFRLTPRIINHGDRVATAINKLDFFRKASGTDGVPLLEFTTERSVAAGWIERGVGAICRRKLGGSSGEGIVLAETLEQLVDAPLYTRYYAKTHEFRVHVFCGKLIDITQKRFKGGKDARAQAGDRTVVRSHDNGWVHTHGSIDLGDSEMQDMGRSSAALLALLGLDFGAVDVLAILHAPDADGKRRLKSYRICEVNTAPGLENTQTISAYTKAILELKQ
jgi:hypothetical protein